MEAIQFQKAYLFHITFERSYGHNIVFVYLPLHNHTQFLLIIFLIPVMQCKSTVPHQRLFKIKLQPSFPYSHFCNESIATHIKCSLVKVTGSFGLQSSIICFHRVEASNN